MLQEEFKRLTDKPFTEEEFEKIHYVYIFYPGIVTHADIALIWAIGGIRLIEDMLPTARKIDEAEQRVRAARTRYETAKEHLNAVLSGETEAYPTKKSWCGGECGMGQMTLTLVLLIPSGLLIAKCLSRAGWNKAALALLGATVMLGIAALLWG